MTLTNRRTTVAWHLYPVLKILNGSYTNFVVCILKCVHTVGLVLSPYIHFTVAMEVSMPSQNVSTHWQDKKCTFY
jgi:ligand-binding sensor protein